MPLEPTDPTLPPPPADHPELFGNSEELSARTSTDITARKHRGSATSQAAHRRISPALSKCRQQVLACIAADPAGKTTAEVAAALGKEMHKVSGRLTELKKTGHIYNTKQVRDGGYIHRATAKGTTTTTQGQ